LSSPYLIGSEIYRASSYGGRHPLAIPRVSAALDLIRAMGWLEEGRYIDSPIATPQQLARFHAPDYIAAIQRAESLQRVPEEDRNRYNIGRNGNPIFPEIFRRPATACGGTLKAVEMLNGAGVVYSPAGGTHHGRPDRANGFCYFNDPVLGILALLDRGLTRVFYLDIDAHHGDGVQAAFYDTDKVLTISLHETGRTLFPGTGFEQETGEGPGKGYCVNVPLPPEAGDELFVRAFRSVVPVLVERFRPDVIVSQLGVDTFWNDPLAHLNVTTGGFCTMVEMIRSMAPKWVALGGGGYDAGNVARAWTLAWAIMNHVEAPDAIPPSFLQQFPGAGFRNSKLRDAPR
jgi:acetoin utilization protein AcuC